MIYLDDFTFPSLPERISVVADAICQTYSLMDGKAAIPNGPDIKTVKWSGVFFGRKRRGTVLVGKWTKPEECVAFLEDAIRDKKAMNLIVEGAPINLDVNILSFNYEASGAFGDIEYTIELQEARTLKVYTVSDLNIKPFAKTVETRPDSGQGGDSKSYTVVSGDNLWKIARKFYGGTGSDWEKIYAANQSAIEDQAKKHGKASSDHGHWIYPGCGLTIP